MVHIFAYPKSQFAMLMHPVVSSKSRTSKLRYNYNAAVVES
jgi:hypothetical protein